MPMLCHFCVGVAAEHNRAAAAPIGSPPDEKRAAKRTRVLEVPRLMLTILTSLVQGSFRSALWHFLFWMCAQGIHLHICMVLLQPFLARSPSGGPPAPSSHSVEPASNLHPWAEARGLPRRSPNVAHHLQPKGNWRCKSKSCPLPNVLPGYPRWKMFTLA